MSPLARLASFAGLGVTAPRRTSTWTSHFVEYKISEFYSEGGYAAQCVGWRYRSLMGREVVVSVLS